MQTPPKLGALGVTFTAMRAMQFASLIAIIGMTANFVSEIVGAGQQPFSVLIGTLVVSAIATLYVVITYILYYDSMLPLLIATGCDSALLIASIVVACTVGKPLSYLSCPALPADGDGSTGALLAAVGSKVSLAGDHDYLLWTATSQRTCYAIKAVWGLSIALCVLFAFSAITAVCLWRRLKMTPAPANKDIEG